MCPFRQPAPRDGSIALPGPALAVWGSQARDAKQNVLFRKSDPRSKILSGATRRGFPTPPTHPGAKGAARLVDMYHRRPSRNLIGFCYPGNRSPDRKAPAVIRCWAALLPCPLRWLKTCCHYVIYHHHIPTAFPCWCWRWRWCCRWRWGRRPYLEILPRRCCWLWRRACLLQECPHL